MPADSNTWIFQGNPEIWNVSGGLDQLRHWVVRQHKDHITAGDRLFIWESGKQAGIVAKATVTRGPAFLEDTSEEITHYPKGPPSDFRGPQLRVELEINKVLHPRIPKAELMKHPILRYLNILKYSRGTNFSVTPQQADVLEELVMHR